MSAPLLQVDNLTVAYRRGLSNRADQVAVRNVSFRVSPGQTLGLIGESGSGKSTVLSAIAGLVPPAGGQIRFEGEALSGTRRAPAFRRAVSMLFQSAAVDPLMTVHDILLEPLRNWGRLSRDEERQRALALLRMVELPESAAMRRPGALSGGQVQRVAIARALALRPRLLLADEPVSALDASVRAQVLDVIGSLCREHGIACVFVTHDLGVARRMCDELCILKSGRIVEQGARARVFAAPQHRYTKQLLASVLPVNPAGREQAALRRRQAEVRP